MTILEKIKRFFRINKNQPKLLMPPKKNNGNSNENSDYEVIKQYIENGKYAVDMKLSMFEQTALVKRKLISKYDTMAEGKVGKSHDKTVFAGGKLSGADFICLLMKNLPDNRYGQTIITENSYIDISTKIDRRKIKKFSTNDNYQDLNYREYKKNSNGEELYEYDKELERYYRKLKLNNFVFVESAQYEDEEQIKYMEANAQPTSDENEILEYSKITGLQYIASEDKHSIADIIKSEPYVVHIELTYKSKDVNSNSNRKVIKVFKSKKECLVGYRPEMILIEESNGEDKSKLVYRLLKDGKYVDNSSFKKNFEGKYSIKNTDLEEIQGQIDEMLFDIPAEAKKVIRNGPKIPEYVRHIYESGIEKINKDARK